LPIAPIWSCCKMCKCACCSFMHIFSHFASRSSQQSPTNSRCFTLHEEEVTNVLLTYGRNPSPFMEPKNAGFQIRQRRQMLSVPFRMCLSHICTPSTFKLHCNVVCPHTGLSLVGFVTKLLCAFLFCLRRNT
jgi:hypothetical protein